MSAESPSASQPEERRTAQTVSGYLATIAIFVSLVGVAWHPLRLILPALLISLIAAGMGGGPGNRLQLASTMICGGCLFLGLTIAVITSHPLW